MSKVPSLGYVEIVRALQLDGWMVLRQRGSHLRLQKRIGSELLKRQLSVQPPRIAFRTVTLDLEAYERRGLRLED